MWEPAFFQAQGRADLGQIIDEGRALLCSGENYRSLTVWFPISNTTFRRSQTAATEEIRNVVEQSQQTLNCALSVDLL
ncbi:MAG: hypothetical protein DME84_06440 [Verrucomicrobia bacterium]|nr:MAG: hypothetical protein DME84_06440 [Verrucomicrobiota bacterium]